MVPNAMMICTSGQIEAGNFFEAAWRWGGVAERPLWATFCINPNPDPTWPLLLLSGFLWPRRFCGHFAGMRGFIAAGQLEEEEDPSMENGDGFGWKALRPCGPETIGEDRMLPHY